MVHPLPPLRKDARSLHDVARGHIILQSALVEDSRTDERLAERRDVLLGAADLVSPLLLAAAHRDMCELFAI